MFELVFQAFDDILGEIYGNFSVESVSIVTNAFDGFDDSPLSLLFVQA